MVDKIRDLKTIKRIIVHCSDTDLDSMDNIDEIRRIHTQEKHWSDIGYHYFIDKRGKVFAGRDIKKVGAHCAGHNFDSIGICFSGKKEFTDKQFQAALALINELMQKFKLGRWDVYPHNFYNKDKSCPNFLITKIWKFENGTVT